MKMLKKLGISIVLQMLGTLSSLLLVIVISRSYGMMVQGQFAMIKTWIDLTVVVLGFGLPQSFIFAINKLKISQQYLFSITLKYSLALPTFVFLLTYCWFEYAQNQTFLFAYDYIFIAIAISFLIGHAFLRGVFLTYNDRAVFAIVSILPAVGLFCFFLFNIYFDNQNLKFSILYLLTACVSYGILILLLRKYTIKNIETVGIHKIVPWEVVFRNGFSGLIQSLALTFLPLAVFYLMSQFDLDEKQIGLMNVALYSYLILALPLNMILPIFFNHWSKLKNKELANQELRKFIVLGFLLTPMVVLLYYLLPYAMPILFGEEAISAVESAQILTFAILPLYLCNILSCFINSQGFFFKTAMACFFKALGTLAVIGLLFVTYYPSLSLVAIGWVFGDLLFLMLLFLHKQKILKNNY